MTSQKLIMQMNQSVESSISHIDEWDQADFDELHPSLTSNDRKHLKRPNLASCFALLESRFLMHDLIKITSRKSSSKIITFYFRIPLFSDYNSQALEHNIVQNLDQKPTIKYTFAFKRKVIYQCFNILQNYKEVSVSFEFSKEEDAKQCITNVSSIYKKLKNKK